MILRPSERQARGTGCLRRGSSDHAIRGEIQASGQRSRCETPRKRRSSAREQSIEIVRVGDSNRGDRKSTVRRGRDRWRSIHRDGARSGLRSICHSSCGNSRFDSARRCCIGCRNPASCRLGRYGSAGSLTAGDTPGDSFIAAVVDDCRGNGRRLPLIDGRIRSADIH